MCVQVSRSNEENRARVCVCVCVCVRERERERERDSVQNVYIEELYVVRAEAGGDPNGSCTLADDADDENSIQYIISVRDCGHALYLYVCIS